MSEAEKIDLPSKCDHFVLLASWEWAVFLIKAGQAALPRRVAPIESFEITTSTGQSSNSKTVSMKVNFGKSREWHDG